MAAYRLTPRANLDVMFDAEIILYPDAYPLPETIQRRLFASTYGHCPTVGYEIDGVDAGGAILHGDQFHIAVLPAFYGRWGRLWQPTLDWLFTHTDYVDGCISKDNLRSWRFAERFSQRSGFPCIAEDDESITYRMSRQIWHQSPARRGTKLPSDCDNTSSFT